MQQKLNWSAYTHQERLAIIEKVKNTISNNGGSILHFNMFSDLALSLTIEVEENHIVQLHERLSKLLTVSELADKKFRVDTAREWIVFMNISFGNGKGEMKIEVPAVPG